MPHTIQVVVDVPEIVGSPVLGAVKPGVLVAVGEAAAEPIADIKIT